MKVKVIRWTVCFSFPDGPAYPTEDGEFQSEMNDRVKSWDNKEGAEKFAQFLGGKYGYSLMPIEISTEIY